MARRKTKTELSPDGGSRDWPRFAVRYCPRHPIQTDAQYELSRRLDEEWAVTMGIALGLAQDEATALGYHRDCEKRACRRARACVSRRAEDDWSVFPGPMFPPCCAPFDRLEPVRKRIRESAPPAGSAQGE